MMSTSRHVLRPRQLRSVCTLLLGALLTAAGTLRIARADVVAHWSFDQADASGVYPDLVNNAHPATPADRGSVSVVEANGGAKFGNAVRLNGSSAAYFTIPPLTGIQKNSFTVATWVNFATPGPSFVLTDWPSFTSQAFVFGINPLGRNKNTAQPIADLASSERTNNRGNRLSIVRQAVAEKPVPQNEWHHLTWIWDRDAKVLTTYLDGDSLGEVPKPTGNNYSKTLDLAVNNHPMRIGSQEAAQNNVVPTFNGGLDELWIFDKALSRAQLRNLIKYNDIQGESAVATVVPSPNPTPTVASNSPTPTPTVNPSTSAPVTLNTAVVETTPIPVRTVDSSLGSAGTSRLAPGRVIGIIGCLIVIVSMSCYLIWAVMERGKLRTAGRL